MVVVVVVVAVNFLCVSTLESGLACPLHLQDKAGTISLFGTGVRGRRRVCFSVRWGQRIWKTGQVVIIFIYYVRASIVPVSYLDH